MTLEQFRQEQAELASIVRAAMAYGPDPVLDARFRQSRAQIQAHYAPLRPSFDRVWTTSTDPRRFPQQHTDPIEGLLASPTLDDLLQRDPRRIQRDLDDIQTAFELCHQPGQPAS